MKYTKTSGVVGKWIKGSEVQSGSRAKLVSETNPSPSQFKNKDGSVKMQDVAKIQFDGGAEPLNISLNRASINALVDAFGEDSAKWQGHALTVETEKMRVAGKAVTVVYLIPEGYERVDDANGYAVIVKKGSQVDGPEEFPQVDLDEAPF